MQAIQTILNVQPKVSNKVLSTSGLCVWISWSNGSEPRVIKMLEESGGLEVANTPTQSLWFFFSIEVTLYALAKLDIWGKQFSTGITIFTFPGDLVVGPERTLSIEIEQEFTGITTGNPQSIVYIFTHPALWPYSASLPGISFYDMTILEKQGLFGWKMITADRRLPFSAEHGWFAFLHPLANPLDRSYHKGWGKIFATLEPLLEEHKLKYSLHGGFLNVSIGNIQQLRFWVEQTLVIFDEMREHHQDIYCPCLSVVVDKNNLNFTSDLHEKLEIPWDTLSPDQPYLNYKNAFLLGNNFTIHDVHYSSQATDIEALCTVSLKSLAPANPALNLLIAKVMTPSHTTCFYCGSGSHKPSDCPSKSLEPLDPMFWHTLNMLDFASANNYYRTIDLEVNENGVGAYASMIANKDDGVSKLLEATFAINSFCQLPNVARIWQISTRDMNEVSDKQPPQKEPAWTILRRLTQPSQDLNAIERDCNNQIAKTPKIWHLHCLRGFIAMEKQDYDTAMNAWRDAENICTITTHQVWIKFLVARLKETQGLYAEALELYGSAKNLLPTWKDLEYRMHVCRIKMGFGEATAKILANEIADQPELLQKAILDPELGRGRSSLVTYILPAWESAHSLFLLDSVALGALLQTLKDWFDETESPMIFYGAKIKALLAAVHIKNYILFLDFARFRPTFENDLTRIINQGISAIKYDYEKCLAKVESIRDEMNWFYFQRALADFNTTFNDCARILNWAFISNFNDVAVYKEAREKLPELQGLVDHLKSKLGRLRMVRDVTLFVLLMLKTFFKTATVLVGLSLITVFTLLFYGDRLDMSWLQSIIKTNFWGLLKVVLSITLMLSLGLASLKTTVLFEKNRDKLLKTAKDERIQSQKQRIEKAKTQRKTETQRAKKLAENIRPSKK